MARSCRLDIDTSCMQSNGSCMQVINVPQHALHDEECVLCLRSVFLFLLRLPLQLHGESADEENDELAASIYVSTNHAAHQGSSTQLHISFCLFPLCLCFVNCCTQKFLYKIYDI
eukprot:c24172_g3_i2 orf=831-1175(-)